MAGLVLIGLPIGNSDDISVRAKAKLADIGTIVAEDTRVIKDLLKRLDVDYQGKRIFAFHDHSQESSLKGILELMQKEEVAYVSDAGSPIISDPALSLVRLALDNHIPVDTLPGANAVITALELSGLPATPFHFHGFLPREKGKIIDFAKTMKGQYGTHVFFEGVSRALKTMDILAEFAPEWDYAICRELTKTYQSVHRFRGSEWGQEREKVEERGEFVLLAHNPERVNAGSQAALELAQEILKKGAKPKLLSKLLAELTGGNASEIYSSLQR